MCLRMLLFCVMIVLLKSMYIMRGICVPLLLRTLGYGL